MDGPLTNASVDSNKDEILNWLERYSVEAAIRKKSQANIDVQMAKKLISCYVCKSN